MLTVMAKQRREALRFLHQARVHIVRRHAHDRALFPCQHKIFGCLTNTHTAPLAISAPAYTPVHSCPPTYLDSKLHIFGSHASIHGSSSSCDSKTRFVWSRKSRRRRRRRRRCHSTSSIAVVFSDPGWFAPSSWSFGAEDSESVSVVADSFLNDSLHRGMRLKMSFCFSRPLRACSFSTTLQPGQSARSTHLDVGPLVDVGAS